MNDHTRVAKLDRAVENVTRLSVFFTGGLAKVRSWANGQPGASGERSSPRTVLYCDDHERDHEDCIRDGFLDCQTYPIASHFDPVGEAAIRKDRVRQDLERIDRLIGYLENNSEELTRIFERYVTRDPTDKDQRESDDTDLGCASCWRIPGPNTAHWWNPPFNANPTDCAGVLSEPRLLCRGCWEWVRRTGRLPVKDELLFRRDHGKWPKRHEEVA